MIVVADTSPLNYLILIEAVDVLEPLTLLRSTSFRLHPDVEWAVRRRIFPHE